MNVRQKRRGRVLLILWEAEPSSCVITTTIAQKRIRRGNRLRPGRQNLLTKLRHRRTERIHSTFFYAYITHLNCYIHSNVDSRASSSDTKSTRISKHIMYSKTIVHTHMHISYFEVQFCLPTNVECSYMCNIHRHYFMLLSIHDIRCECRRSTLFIMQKFKLP